MFFIRWIVGCILLYEPYLLGGIFEPRLCNMSSIPDVSLIANYNSIFWWEELFLVGGQKQTKKYRNLAEREFFFFSLPVCLENFKYKCNNFQQDHCIVKEHAPKIQNIRFQAWEYFEPLVHALLHCSSQVDSFCTFI